MTEPRSPKKQLDPTAIIVAIIGLVGTIAVAYFGFLGPLATQRQSISATQTAEIILRTATNILPSNTQPSSSGTIVSPTDTPAPTETPTQSSSSRTDTVAISEVMANPCGIKPNGDDAVWNEYVELYNYGTQSVDVNGWWITDGENAKGNPDRIVSWETRYPGITFGNNLNTSSTIIAPGKVAVILPPQYLSGDVRYPEFSRPYLFPEGTVILTIADGNVLGSDDFGIEVVQIRNPIVLYKGTDTEIYKVVSTYGSPVLTSSPQNIKDDEKDLIPLVLKDCYSAERIVVDGADVEINWRAVKDGTPGMVASSP